GSTSSPRLSCTRSGSSRSSSSVTSSHTAEALECLGGNGYSEESGLPRLYREAPLNSIWGDCDTAAILEGWRQQDVCQRACGVGDQPQQCLYCLPAHLLGRDVSGADLRVHTRRAAGRCHGEH